MKPGLAPLPPDTPRHANGFRSSMSGVTVAYAEEWTKHHVIEDDGLCPLLYQYLHKNNKGREHTLTSIRLPDTVVFDHNFPRAWYTYDAENREIAKRPGKALDAQTMYNHFSKETKGCEIVAQFFYSSVRVEDEWEDILSARDKRSGMYAGQQLTYVEFFTTQTLHTFLFQQHRKPDGVLQKFVVPKGEGTSRRNFQLQALWSPLMTTVYRRTNTHRLDDHTIDLAARAASYDGAAYLSEETLVADETKHQVDTLCRDIAEHFYATEHKHITRLNLFFKTDDDGRMWLLWCSCVRVGADSLNPSNLRVPVAFNMRTEVVNEGATTRETLRAQRLRQKQLLALDYELFTASRDFEFALNVNASHKRQARALDMRGLQDVMIDESSRDPRRNPQHPLHESFLAVCDDEDDAVEPGDLGKAHGHGGGAGSGGGAQAGAGGVEGLPEDSVEERVREELAALAMDAWYSIYSTTLSDLPKVMATARVELARPLVGVLTAEELAQLTAILGLLPVQPGGRGASGPAEEAASFRAGGDPASSGSGGPSTSHYAVASFLIGPGRRYDRPSAQVEAEVLQFMDDLFALRGEEVHRTCMEQFRMYFD